MTGQDDPRPASGTEATPERYRFADDGTIPNSHLPLLVWRGVLPGGKTGDPATACEQLFARHGWVNGWRWGIYDFHHFHSTAHEVLGVIRGTGRVRFGGPRGLLLEMRPGDVVLIPAGVGHRNEGSSEDLLVVGAYPEGQSPDLCRGVLDERPRVLAAIADLPVWERLPV